MRSLLNQVLNRNLYKHGIAIFCILFLWKSPVLNAQPHMLFAKQTSGINEDVGYAIATDSIGNTYVTGRFNNTVDFDPGPGVFNMTSNPGFPDDIFVLKLDPNQNLLWAKQWGDIGQEFAYSIQVDDAGCIYVYGYFEGNVDFDPGPGVFNLNAQGASYDVYINKLDAAGNFVWAKRIASGTGDAFGTSMVIDKMGNIYAAGYIIGPADVDPTAAGVLNVGAFGVASLFIAKYDSSGAVQWGKAMVGNNTSNYNNCYSVAVDQHGNVFTTGCFMDTMDFDPGPGTYNLTNSTIHEEIYVNKLDSAGNFLWAKHMQGGASVGQWGRCVLADDSGNVYYTGCFRSTIDFDPGPGVYNITSAPGSQDIFFGKLDSLGNLIWTFALGITGNNGGFALAMDSTNHILLSGEQGGDSLDYDPSAGVHMEYSPNNAQSVFIAKYTTSGDFKCVFLINHGDLTKYTLSHHLAVQGQKAYITGGFISTADFDPCPAVYNQTSLGSHDAFIAAYDFSTCNCALQLSVATTNVLCNGTCSGSASVTPLGGTPPYVYNWFPSGGNNSTASNLCAGSYTCVVIDALGDSVSSIVAITEPSLLATTISGTDVQCNSICNGSAQVTVSGGSPGYTYNWSNVQTTPAVSSLCAGNYSVMATDANGCTSTQSISILQPVAIGATISATSTPCNSNIGAVTANASGGTGTLAYLWTPGSDTTSSINNIAAGVYSVTITDQNGCTLTLSDTVFSIGAPTIDTVGITNILCNGDSSGTITVTANGNGPFAYQWLPSGGSSATASGLTAGNYIVTVTDNAGCTQTLSVALSEPTPILVSINSADDTCSSSSGSISVSPSGGIAPYSYLWSNSQTMQAINNLSGGAFSVTITDVNGCTFDTVITIASTVAPTLIIGSVMNVACFGDSTGAAMISANGGVGPYSYSWQPFGGSNATASAISSGTYTATVTGSDGCSSTITVLVTEPPLISAICASIDENCNYQDGTVFVQASGGTGGFTYLWSDASTSDSVFQLSAGGYSVTITDQNGCIESCAVLLNSTSTANANAGADVTIELGQSTLLSGSGGTMFSWQPSDLLGCNFCASTIATPTGTTTFVLIVTDSAGCIDIDSMVVTVEIPCDDIFVPNAFSPNGDGQNDILFVRGTCIQSFRFAVFNRWGECVFETSDQSIGWDGNWRGGKCETAVFTYVMTGTKTDTELFEKHGTVSLIQ